MNVVSMVNNKTIITQGQNSSRILLLFCSKTSGIVNEINYMGYWIIWMFSNHAKCQLLSGIKKAIKIIIPTAIIDLPVYTLPVISYGKESHV
jgi:hypothetical protein